MSEPKATIARIISTACWAILGVILLVMGLMINHRIDSGHSGDFRHFYFAAGALLDHRDLYGPVPLDVVELAVGRKPNQTEINWYTVDTDRYLYPPLIAMLYTPVARLPFNTAQRISLIVNSLLALTGIVLIARTFVERFGLNDRLWIVAAAALWGVLINLDKLHMDLQMFQTNSLMFCLFAISLYWLDRKPILAGIPLAVILNIKYLSLGLVPWLIIRRRWGSAISCIISSVLFALLPALISGWNTNLHNLTVAYGGLAHMIGIHGSDEQANVDDIRDYLSCSITSAMARTQPVDLQVEPDAAALAAHHVSASQVFNAIEARQPQHPGEMVRLDTVHHNIALANTYATPGILGDIQFRALNGKTVSLRDIARVRTLSENLLRPLLYTAVVAFSAVIVVVAIYRRRKIPAFVWPSIVRQQSQPFHAMIAVEFVCIIAATLCFSPQTNTRHLMMVLLLTIPIAALALGARSWSARLPVMLAGALIFFAFIFPRGGQESRAQELFWFGVGGQCWCLLLAVLLFVGSATNIAGFEPQRRGDAEKRN